jgi:putrescine importer
LGGRRQLPGGIVKLVQAGAGAAAALWLIVSLHKTALTVGITWLTIGLVYLVLRTRGFRRALPQLLPVNEVE